MTIDELVSLLRRIASAELLSASQIGEFQELVFKDKITGTPEDVEVLRDLAYDLEFFEPNPRMRAEDPSYFDERRARSEIDAALARLARRS